MIQSDSTQLYHFVSYFLFLDSNKRKKSKKKNILKIENLKIANIIQSGTIELFHFVSYFCFKIFFQKVLIQVSRKRKSFAQMHTFVRVPLLRL